MNNATLRLALLAAALGAALSAHALTLSYTITPNQTVTIPAFDASLGTLASVRIVAAATGQVASAAGGIFGCASSLSVQPTGGTASDYYRHFYHQSHALGGGSPPVVSGERAFSDTAPTVLPLDWGLVGMTATWSSMGTPPYGYYDLSGTYGVQLTYTPVPEPASFAALGLGALGLLNRRRRK